MLDEVVRTGGDGGRRRPIDRSDRLLADALLVIDDERTASVLISDHRYERVFHGDIKHAVEGGG